MEILILQWIPTLLLFVKRILFVCFNNESFATISTDTLKLEWESVNDENAIESLASVFAQFFLLLEDDDWQFLNNFFMNEYSYIFLYMALGFCFLFGCLILLSLYEKDLFQIERLSTYCFMVFILYSGMCTYFLFPTFYITNTYYFNNLIFINSYSIFCFNLLFISFALFMLISRMFTLQFLSLFSSEYFVPLFVVLGFSLLLSLSNNLILTLLCIETISFCLYFLAALQKNSAYSLEAGIKYFITGSYSSALFILGISLIHISFGTSHYNEIIYLLLSDFSFFSELTGDSSILSLNFYTFFENAILLVGLLCFFIGFLFKLGAAPFHFWLPDVYAGSTLPVTFLFSSPVKVAFFLPFLKLVMGVFYSFAFFWSLLFQCVAFCSIFIGSLGLFRQTQFKRFFAYSSINHVGFMLAVLSIGSIESLSNVLFYLIGYMFLISMIFLYLLQFIGYNSKTKTYFEVTYLSDLAKIFANVPYNYLFLLQSIVFFFALFSLAGMPPLLGFSMKFAGLVAFFHGAKTIGQFILLGCLIITSLLSAFNYLRILKIWFFDTTHSSHLYFISLCEQESNIRVDEDLTVVIQQPNSLVDLNDGKFVYYYQETFMHLISSWLLTLNIFSFFLFDYITITCKFVSFIIVSPLTTIFLLF